MDLVAKCFPHAEVCLDNFHITKDCTWVSSMSGLNSRSTLCLNPRIRGVAFMIIHPLLIELTAKTRHLEIPDALEKWLLVMYSWEPFDGFWNPEDLMDAIEAHCIEYHKGNLDVSIPAQTSLWKERAETTGYIILHGIILEKDHLAKEYRRPALILEDNHISC